MVIGHPHGEGPVCAQVHLLAETDYGTMRLREGSLYELMG